MVAGLDGCGGAADRLAVAPERLAGREGAQRDLVSGGHRLAHGDLLSADGDDVARGKRHTGDGDVIGGM